MKIKKDYQYVSVSNITFYLSDDEGNILENKDGSIKEFYFNGRLKLTKRQSEIYDNLIKYLEPLDYLCKDMTVEDLEEIKEEQQIC
jgi:hypothetical protein